MIEEKNDLWHYLSQSDKPITVYGMGDGADKLISALERIGRHADDFFASDGFVRGQSFHNKRVLSFSQIKEKYVSPIILVSFGSERDDVVDMISQLSNKEEVYLPDVPVAGQGIFDRAYFDEHMGEIEAAYELFEDELSRLVFCDVIMYKLTGKIEYLLENTQSDTETYSIFDSSKWRCVADLGAYNGDSAAFISGIAPGSGRIIALEPDRKNFIKLERSAQTLPVTLEAHNICAWSEKTTLIFDRGGNRNSSVGAIGHTASVGDTKQVCVQADTLDNVIGDTNVDFIKYDVEGSELEALKGSVKAVERCSPDMLVSAYHRNEDIFTLPHMLHTLLPTHKLYLRRKRCLPAWEISLCASKG